MTTLKQHHDQEVHQWFTHFLPAPLSFYLSHKPHSSITFSSLLPSLIIIITNPMQNASLSLAYHVIIHAEINTAFLFIYFHYRKFYGHFSVAIPIFLVLHKNISLIFYLLVQQHVRHIRMECKINDINLLYKLQEHGENMYNILHSTLIRDNRYGNKR